MCPLSKTINQGLDLDPGGDLYTTTHNKHEAHPHTRKMKEERKEVASGYIYTHTHTHTKNHPPTQPQFYHFSSNIFISLVTRKKEMNVYGSSANISAYTHCIKLYPGFLLIHPLCVCVCVCVCVFSVCVPFSYPTTGKNAKPMHHIYVL